jgi:23S rRNA pseudouridine1911/1915/1917 synthase
MARRESPAHSPVVADNPKPHTPFPLPLPLDEAQERIRGEVVVERELTSQHRRLRFTVPRQHAPPQMASWRLDRYLHALLPTISRTMIQRWVDGGAATVNGLAVRGQHKLRALEVVELLAPLPERSTAPEAPPLEILYRDPYLLVVAKPPGLLAHQAGKIMNGTLINQLQDLLAAEGLDPRQARLVNRIDRDTSGIVLVSLDAQAHTTLARTMEARQVRKEYLAIVEGSPQVAAGAWRDPIGLSPDGSIARVVRADGQACHTDFALQESAPHGRYSLLRLRLHTGRQHQIRVHAAHHGLPLVGDWVYGQACRELPGQALHAALLELPHPATGEALVVEAPLPMILSDLWQRLRGGGEVEVMALSEQQRSKLAQSEVLDVRRPSWLSLEDYQRLRQEGAEADQGA